MPLQFYRNKYPVIFKNASAFLLRDARHAMHDIFLLRISAILLEAISDEELTPITDTDLLLATYRVGSHFTSDIKSHSCFSRHTVSADAQTAAFLMFSLSHFSCLSSVFYTFGLDYFRSFVYSLTTVFVYLCQMEGLNQKDPCQTIIRNNSHQIIYRCDQRTGCYCRVYLDLMEKHRNQSSHQTGDHHGCHQ